MKWWLDDVGEVDVGDDDGISGTGDDGGRWDNMKW